MTLEECYIYMQSKCGIKVGDKIKVLRKASNQELGWSNNWNPDMDYLVGNTYNVSEVNKNGICVKRKDCFKNWFLPFFILEKICKPSISLQVADSDVIISETSLKFGCTTLSKDEVDLLVKEWQEYHKV